MKRKDLRDAFAPMPPDCYDALMDAAHSIKEEPVMKRKLSVALVCMLSLLLLVGVAFAIAHFTEAGEQIAAMEAEKGPYYTWDAQDRVTMVRLLVEGGVLPADERVDTLLSGTLDDAAASALATDILTDWGPDWWREDTIVLMSILEAMWGDMPLWTLAQKIWYQDTMLANGTFGEDTGQRLLWPGEGDIPQAEAEQTAARALEAAFGLPDGALDKAQAAGEFYTMEDGGKANWYVLLYLAENEVGTQYYHAVVDGQTGTVIADPLLSIQLPEDAAAERAAFDQMRETMESDPIYQAMNDYWDTWAPGQYYFYDLSLEGKAAFTRDIRPMILQRLADDPQAATQADWIPFYLTTYAYDLPGPSHIPEADALARAQAAILADQPIREDMLALYAPYIYFDITDAEHPLWRFYFNAYNNGTYGVLDTWPEDSWARGYRVEIDATDGAVVSLWVDLGRPMDDHVTGFEKFL